MNHEAWAIPYADLMTLLLAFFVVMYAVSVVNVGKYRVVSRSISEAFNGSTHVTAAAPGVSAVLRAASPALSASAAPSATVPTPMRTPDARKVVAETPPASQEQENLTRIQNQVQQALQPLIDKQLVVVRRTPNWLEIEIRTDILFSSGVARLTRPADAVLNSLAGILAPFSNPLRVEGYTDDKPINTAVYPSNWELSAARAASVARLFAGQGVSPDRLGIIGWGQFRPAADNATVEGRNRNRRVLVVVLSDHATPTRYSSDPDHAGKQVDHPVRADTVSAAGTPGDSRPGDTKPGAARSDVAKTRGVITVETLHDQRAPTVEVTATAATPPLSATAKYEPATPVAVAMLPGVDVLKSASVESPGWPGATDATDDQAPVAGVPQIVNAEGAP